MPLTVEPVGEAFVAKASGVDLRQPMDAATITAIETAVERYGVLIIPGQPLTAHEQVHFAGGFGSLEVTSEGFSEGDSKEFWKRDATIGDERVAEISNLDRGRALFGGSDPKRFFGYANRHWHTDSTFRPVRARFTMLSACKVPDATAATQFADMCAAYAALPERIRRMIDELEAEHTASRVLEMMGVSPEDGISVDFPPQQWPLVTILADGRRALCVPSHASHIVGRPVPDGRVLLMELREFATQPQFVHQHVWTTGDFVIWDDRSTLHRAMPFEDESVPRELRRSVVEDRTSLSLSRQT